MIYILSILCLFIFSCDSSENQSNCNNLNVTESYFEDCDFQADITLLNNSEPIEGADVYIRYKCNPESSFSWCEQTTTLRPSTSIELSLVDNGEILLEIYDLENNLFETIADGYYIQGQHSFTFEPTLPPFGMAVYIIKVKVIYDDENVLDEEQYVYLITAPDFAQIENLGQTDISGLFVLTSEYRKWIPTFFNLPSQLSVDELGNELGTFYIDELVDGFEVIFFYEDTYKLFDIDLRDGYFDYNFNWEDGEIFNP